MGKKPTHEELEQRVKELEREVSECNRAAEVLRQEQSVFIGGPVVIFTWLATENWPAAYVSPNVTQFGYQADDFVSGRLPYTDIIHREDLDKVLSEVKEYSESGVPFYEQEYRIIQADGETRWVHDFTIVRRNDESKITHYDGYILDITDRKQAEKRLKESEEKYRTQFEEALDAIFIADAETGLLLDCNRAAPVLVGREKSEIIGKHQRILHPPEGVEGEFSRTFKQHLENKEGQVLETQVITKDGEIRDVAIKANIFEMKGRRFLQGIFRDITDRKRMEEALRESENKYHDLYDNAPDMYVSVDAKTAEIIECNQTLVNELGYTRKEIIGRPIFDMYTPDSAEFSRRKVFPEFVKTGKIEGEELQLQRKDGTTVDVYLKASAVRDPEGIILHSISSWRDISEKRKLEAQLQHAQKLESIGTLTSGIAHNFRNLLTPISLYSQFLQMAYKDDPQLQEMAEKTGESVKRGAQLVDGLMQFCRKHAKEIETIDLAEVIRETYDLITKSFDKKIDIRMDIADSLPIRGDRSELSQVFMNLCTNARDAMPDGGELSIEASMEGDEALITISDTGLGMDEQTRRQCFDPFFTTKEVDKGTGLGLSTTYGIVKDHGGEIHVFSGLNKGTTFKLYFPLALSDEHQRQAGVHEIVQGSGEKVLIVDDEADVLEALVMLAERLGYSAASADSGKAGIDKYKSWRPDVVLLDRNMPGMDGLNCARSIFEYDPGARIVLISGYDKGGPSGIDDKTKDLIKWYLTKPINMGKISQTIRKVLDKD